MSRLGHEIVAGRVAIEQALFFHFRLTIREISSILNVKYSTVYWNVWRTKAAVIPWSMRKHKAEAIQAAACFVPQSRQVE